MIIFVHLFVTLTAVLIGVVAMAIMRNAMPKNSESYKEIFAAGAIYPYNQVVSIKVGCLLPWRAIPKSISRKARISFKISKISVFVAIISIVLLVIRVLFVVAK